MRDQGSFATDPKQSAQSRVKMLTMLAQNKTRLLAYHFVFPGIEHVAKEGDGFRYYPEGMDIGCDGRFLRERPRSDIGYPPP